MGDNEQKVSGDTSGGTEHGKGLAALTPVIIEASYKGNYFKFAKIARIFGGLTAGDLSGKIRTLLRNIDMECSLSELGIEEKDVG